MDSRWTIIDGGQAVNLLFRTAGGELINGLGGKDTLKKLGGDDMLLGGIGKDTHTGGAGPIPSCSISRASNVDDVTDFTHLGDRLRLGDDVFTQFAARGAMKVAHF